MYLSKLPNVHVQIANCIYEDTARKAFTSRWHDPWRGHLTITADLLATKKNGCSTLENTIATTTGINTNAVQWSPSTKL